MNGSFKLFAVRGIDIRIHYTFPLILLFVAWQYGRVSGLNGALFGVIMVLLLFAVVTLHELGHSFAALYYGIPTQQIVLLPIGGAAQLREMPKRPWQEFVITLAGPAVNVVLALLFATAVFLLRIPIIDTLLQPTLSPRTFLVYLLVHNIILALFNLIPAFPMDGGRILRAILAMFFSYERATAVAVNVGRVIAVLFIVGTLLTDYGSLSIALIGLFVLWAGSQELAMVKGKHQRPNYDGYRVQQVYTPHAGILGPYDNLRQALMAQMQGGQFDFPVADNDRYIGFVTEDSLLRAANLYGPDALIYAAMSTDVQPVSPQTDLQEAYQQMARLRVRTLPVVEYGRLLGIVTYRQIQEFVRMAAAWSQADKTPIVGV